MLSTVTHGIIAIIFNRFSPFYTSGESEDVPARFHIPPNSAACPLEHSAYLPLCERLFNLVHEFQYERVVSLIYTKRKYLERYLGMSGSMDSAILHLLRADLGRLHKGRSDIDGGRAFVNRFDYQTMPPEQAIWEGHAKYADIHVLLSGHEKIGVTHAEALKMVAQKPEEDFIGYEGDVEVWFPMTTEDILIVFPEDAHMVKVMDGDASLVEKACYKFNV